MKNKYAIVGFILVLACVVSLSACASRSMARSVSKVGRTLNDSYETETFTLDVSQVADSVDLDMRYKLKSGSVRWTLTDPEGEVRWEGTVARREQVSRRFSTIAGEWRLELTAESATGEYACNWQAIGTQLERKY